MNSLENKEQQRNTFFHSPSRCGAAWRRYRDSSLRSRLKSSKDISYWESAAEKIRRWSAKESSRERIKMTIQWLKEQKVLFPGMSILDIGAGTGSFSIPFVEMGARVVALEPALNLAAIMEENLKENLPPSLSKQITILPRLWEDFNPREEGLEEKFDLVFASLTPGVYDEETLLKMMACSRKWCFLCEFAGRRHNPPQEDLWQKIFQEAMPLPEYNIFFPLLYLYSLGYAPSLKLWTESWEDEEEREEAEETLCRFFARYIEMTAQIKGIIAAYVGEKLRNGKFHHEHKVLLGMILWNIREKWEQR